MKETKLLPRPFCGERRCGMMAKILDFKPQKKTVTNAFFIDYKPSENCRNDESYDSLCVKCGKCGRKFIGAVLQKGGW